MGRLTALEKFGGGFCSIARRHCTVDHTNCCSHYFLMKSGGGECVAHAVQSLTDFDSRVTILSIDGISAFDLIFRAAMLDRFSAFLRCLNLQRGVPRCGLCSTQLEVTCHSSAVETCSSSSGGAWHSRRGPAARSLAVEDTSSIFSEASVGQQRGRCCIPRGSGLPFMALPDTLLSRLDSDCAFFSPCLLAFAATVLAITAQFECGVLGDAVVRWNLQLPGVPRSRSTSFNERLLRDLDVMAILNWMHGGLRSLLKAFLFSTGPSWRLTPPWFHPSMLNILFQESRASNCQEIMKNLLRAKR